MGLTPPNRSMMLLTYDMAAMCAKCERLSSAKCAQTCEQSVGTMAAMIQTSDVSERLQALRTQAGLSMRAAAAELGMSPSSYNHYEVRYKRPYLPADFAQQVAEVFARHGVPRDLVMALAGPSPVSVGYEPQNGEQLINVWDIEARAGHGAVVPEYETIAYKLSFPPDYLRSITSSHPRNLEIINVKGKSMVPTLDNDDIVMVDRTKTMLGYDGVFVLKMDDTLHVKRVARAAAKGRVRIISDNRYEFPEVERAVEDIEVIGKVVWAGKRM